MSKKQLIELALSGKSAAYIIDALMEELPPVPVIRQTILNNLPKGSDVQFEENVVFVQCPDRRVLLERLHYFEVAYPELEFVPVTDD